MYSHSAMLFWKISKIITYSVGSCRIQKLGKTIKLTCKIVQKYLDNTLHYTIAITKFKCFVFVLRTQPYWNTGTLLRTTHNNNNNKFILSSFQETLKTIHSNSEVHFRTYLHCSKDHVSSRNWLVSMSCFFVLYEFRFRKPNSWVGQVMLRRWQIERSERSRILIRRIQVHSSSTSSFQQSLLIYSLDAHQEG